MMETWSNISTLIRSYVTDKLKKSGEWTDDDTNRIIIYYTDSPNKFRRYMFWLDSQANLVTLPVNVEGISNISLKDFLDLLFAKAIRIKCETISEKVMKELNLLKEVGGEDMDLVDPPEGHVHLSDQEPDIDKSTTPD